MTARQAPASCTGDCEAGQRDCTCGSANLCGQPLAMWADEQASPGRAALLYGLALLAGRLGAHGQAAGWW